MSGVISPVMTEDSMEVSRSRTASQFSSGVRMQVAPAYFLALRAMAFSFARRRSSSSRSGCLSQWAFMRLRTPDQLRPFLRKGPVQRKESRAISGTERGRRLAGEPVGAFSDDEGGARRRFVGSDDGPPEAVDGEDVAPEDEGVDDLGEGDGAAPGAGLGFAGAGEGAPPAMGVADVLPLRDDTAGEAVPDELGFGGKERVQKEVEFPSLIAGHAVHVQMGEVRPSGPGPQERLTLRSRRTTTRRPDI